LLGVASGIEFSLSTMAPSSPLRAPAVNPLHFAHEHRSAGALTISTLKRIFRHGFGKRDFRPKTG